MVEEVAAEAQVTADEEAPPPSIDEAQLELQAAREAAGYEVGELIAAARAAVDIPARVRRNPLKTAAVVGGTGFVLFGGPRRVARRVEHAVFPERQRRFRSVLPEEITRVVSHLGEEGPEVQAHLERDFLRYLQKAHPGDPPNPRRSFWRTYDILAGILGAVAGRILIRRLVDGPRDRPRGTPPPAVEPTPAEQLDAIDSAAGRVVER
jgi:hypothetical protein